MSSKTKTLILAVLITVIWSASSIADEVVINDEKITNWLLVDSAHDRVIVMSQQKPV